MMRPLGGQLCARASPTPRTSWAMQTELDEEKKNIRVVWEGIAEWEGWLCEELRFGKDGCVSKYIA